MSDHRLLPRAAALWEAGDRSASLRLLSAAMRAEPGSISIRRTLAERQRELGNPDQAARWGIVFDGWTTARERDRLARLLAASGIDESHAPAFLGLQARTLPSDLRVLFDGPVAEYGERFRARDQLKREQGETGDHSPMIVVAIVLWFLFALASIGGACVIVTLVAVDAASPGGARVFALVGAGLLAIALAASATAVGRPRPARTVIAWALPALAVGTLVGWGAISGWAVV